MDLRVLVLTSDSALGQLLKAQIDNLGCGSAVAADFDSASGAFDWADAVLVDLAGGLDDLHRLRDERPTMRVVAVAPDAETSGRARAAGAYSVLVEPFAISDIVEHIRGVARGADTVTVDLRDSAAAPSSGADDGKPWWATR